MSRGIVMARTMHGRFCVALTGAAMSCATRLLQQALECPHGHLVLVTDGVQQQVSGAFDCSMHGRGYMLHTPRGTQQLRQQHNAHERLAVRISTPVTRRPERGARRSMPSARDLLGEAAARTLTQCALDVVDAKVVWHCCYVLPKLYRTECQRGLDHDCFSAGTCTRSDCTGT